jgi:hypothetical protein
LNKGVTISLQSVDPNTLKSIKRQNISSASFQELQRRFTRDRVETYSDMILGLPGETHATFVDGIAHVIENGQHNRIQFNNLAILPNAEMGDPEYQKQYGMITVQSKIINIHGALNEEDPADVQEMQEMVIATNSMPKADWVKTRAFCWMTALLHFDKVLQIPMEAFFTGQYDSSPILQEVREFFIQAAQDIQDGSTEYMPSTNWLNIYWPTDEYMLIKLAKENKLEVFYRAAEELLTQLLKDKFAELPPGLLRETINLNKNLLKLPFQKININAHLSYNIWEFYKSVLHGTPIPLENKPAHYFIDRTSISWSSWDDWCREVIWYGNKKGAYLYANNSVEPQLAGHF